MKVSIFTPTHDSSFLTRIYQSIREQPFYEWIIVHNNGSKPIQWDDPRVKQFTLDDTAGWVGPLKSYACSMATGDILLELDHDDLLLPGAVREVIKAFSEDSEVGFVYSNSVHMRHGADGSQGKGEHFDEGFGWRYRNYDFDGLELEEHVSFQPTPDSISRIWFAPNHLRAFRRSVYEQAGGYNTNMRVLDDQDLMSRLYQVTKFRHIDKPLYLYRIHGENTWLKHNAEIQENVWPLYDRYIEPMVEAWSAREGLRAVELGGRMAAKPGYQTLDLKDADIIADLNQPWPFADSSVGVFRSYDVFEHLKDPVHTMKEVSRVLAPGGWLFVQVPSSDGRGAFSDPTHVSLWNELSFHYYTKANKAKYIDTPVRFYAPRLYTTPVDHEGVCWVRAHLVNMKDGYRPAGWIEI